MKTPLATNMCVVNFDHLAAVLHRPCVDVVLADLVMWGGIQSMADLGGVTPLFGFDLTIYSAFELGIGMGRIFRSRRRSIPCNARSISGWRTWSTN